MAPTSESALGPGAGQASAELVAILPALAVCLLIAAQVVAAGWALWSAGNAARAGARAERVGSDGEAGWRRPPPPGLPARGEGPARDGVRVRVRIPRVLPGIELPAIAASSTLDVGG